jgi:hypothetical protein
MIATLTKLLAIRIVANRIFDASARSGISRRDIILLAPSESSDFRPSICVGVKEKNATSEPEKKALKTSKTNIENSGIQNPAGGKSAKRMNRCMGSQLGGSKISD